MNRTTTRTTRTTAKAKGKKMIAGLEKKAAKVKTESVGAWQRASRYLKSNPGKSVALFAALGLLMRGMLRSRH